MKYLWEFDAFQYNVTLKIYFSTYLTYFINIYYFHDTLTHIIWDVTWNACLFIPNIVPTMTVKAEIVDIVWTEIGRPFINHTTYFV